MAFWATPVIGLCRGFFLVVRDRGLAGHRHRNTHRVGDARTAANKTVDADRARLERAVSWLVPEVRSDRLLIHIG